MNITEALEAMTVAIDLAIPTVERLSEVDFSDSPKYVMKRLHSIMDKPIPTERLLGLSNRILAIAKHIDVDYKGINLDGQDKLEATIREVVSNAKALNRAVFSLHHTLYLFEGHNEEELSEEVMFEVGVMVDNIENYMGKTLDSVVLLENDPVLTLIQQMKYVLFGL